MNTTFAHTRLFLLLLAALHALQGNLGAQSAASPVNGTRPVAVADSIEMTRLGTPLSDFTYEAPVTFSPDGQLFVVVTRKGNIQRNANDYQLLMFHAADASRAPTPEVLVTFSSTSNRPGVDNPRWVNNTTVAFIGACDDMSQQIYSYDVLTRRLTQRTHLPTDIVAFDSTADFATLVYQAHPRVRSFFDQKALDHGFVVSHEWLGDLMAGQTSDYLATYIYADELFVQHSGDAPDRVEISDKPMPFIGINLSPDGAYAVIGSEPTQLPEAWKQYTEFAGADNPGGRYLLIDTKRAIARPLIPGNGGSGAPNSSYAFNSKVKWLPVDNSVVVSGALLPLDVPSAPERSIRINTYYTLEVNPVTGAVTTITDGLLNLVRSDAATSTVFLAKSSNDPTLLSSLSAYRKIHGAWKKVDASPHTGAVDIIQEQDMNTPQRLIAVNTKTGEKTLLLDLNPQFRDLRFGRVEAIAWAGKDGHESAGGLYLPPDYSPGTRYPLVIQTHGWTPGQFEIDGESTAGYAAQALAGKNIVVVQMDEKLGKAAATTQEGPLQMNSYEGLIDYLDGRHLIDRQHVALMAWSRTGYGVRYALTFAEYPIATASIVDALEGSYFQYLVELSLDDDKHEAENFYEALNGGNPLHGALSKWEKNATGFNLDKVHAPVRIVAFGPNSILDNNWEWFAGMRHLQKPVEMIWLRNALHMPVRPSERLTAQQGNVDWFCFWLKNEEDPDPAKAEQYARWRELRKQQEGGRRAASVAEPTSNSANLK